MTHPHASPIRITRIEAFVFRAPIANPVRTSFGVMTDRPAVLVRAEDSDGAFGWGEVWCNFPSCGAEHRARLIDTVLAPLLVQQWFEAPEAAFRHLSEETAVLAIQSAEPGPIAQAIAGVDLALWDLCARRAKTPLWQFIRGQPPDTQPARISVYASGINPDHPERTAERAWEAGYRAFKLKIGFGRDRDLANLTAMRSRLGAGIPLMADANQGWSLEEALRMLPDLEPFDLCWLEEPLRADRPWDEWAQLRMRSGIPLAAGENLASPVEFTQAIATRQLSVLQPDAAKWGGISGCWPVIQATRAAHLLYCPHYLGGGIGLLHSAHLLAAAGGRGMLEIDSNPNPLRSLLAGPLEQISDGKATLGSAPGIGFEPELASLASMRQVH